MAASGMNRLGGGGKLRITLPVGCGRATLAAEFADAIAAGSKTAASDPEFGVAGLAETGRTPAEAGATPTDALVVGITGRVGAEAAAELGAGGGKAGVGGAAGTAEEAVATSGTLASPLRCSCSAFTSSPLREKVSVQT